jgi:uncharacterized membrane protein
MVAEYSDVSQSNRARPSMMGPANVYEEYDDQLRWRNAGSRARSTGARNLGILSLALGAGAVLMPRRLARLSGLEPSRKWLPLVGLRELTAGIGLLATQDATPWLWSRVVGDGMDLAVILSSLLSPNNPRKTSAAVTTAIVAAITAIDIRESLRSSPSSDDARTTAAPDALVSSSVIISKSPQECYGYWRDVSNMTRISPLVVSITVLDPRTSRWVIESPLGRKVEWESKITADTPGERISWRSVDGGGLYHAGVVSFSRATGGRGTLVNISMHIRIPGGAAGMGLAKLLGADPHSEVREDLRRFKQLLEAGEVPTTQGQPSGRRSVLGRMTREGRLSRQERSP